MIKKYQLDFEKAKKYFEENLKGTNELSDSVISLVKFESGNFFALLTENSEIEDINQFNSGGKTDSLISEAGEFILNLFKSNTNITCIFDDFNSDLKNIVGDFLFNSNGASCGSEIYYLINEPLANQDLVIQCLRRSNVIWHSLCVVSLIQFKEHKKTLTRKDMEKICLNAQSIMIGAYDAESYIVWEKKESIPNLN